MYNEYDELSFGQQLQLTESQIRRRHQQRMFIQTNAELLQQELDLETQLMEENPELSQAIYDFNSLEIQSQHQGLKSALEGECAPKKSNVWSRFFRV
ncbi:hypothetical protein [Nostoc sp. MG11]|uniref:hypothetical protein n=1 Tax=Nostoc sp. MG11 TaxID=2721166 RepID=UPI001867734F|nr:hypothetical protein [Nostoc sp. MG11]